jgi:biopolymer transport protein ExbB
MIDRFENVLMHAGAGWVLWVLAVLSVASVAVMLDRWRIFWLGRDDFPALVRAVHYALGEGNLEGARKRLCASPSIEAAVGLAGLQQWPAGASAVQEAMAAATGLQRARLEKRLLFLGTIGNNAPFVGLLGTVIGVIGAFQELGNASSSASVTQLAPERVMTTIAEALVATAAGLLVAIPAVAVFNYFQGLLATSLSNADTLGHVLLSHMDDSRRP